MDVKIQKKEGIKRKHKTLSRAVNRTDFQERLLLDCFNKKFLDIEFKYLKQGQQNPSSVAFIDYKSKD